jgi:hypothetical protein
LANGAVVESEILVEDVVVVRQLFLFGWEVLGSGLIQLLVH